MIDVAVVILTGNEELHIERCLVSLANLDPRQIFICDSFSKDKTQTIVEGTAKRLGLNVVFVQRKWPGLYAPQMNWAIDAVADQEDAPAWTIRLDADEYFLPETINEIKEKINSIDGDVSGVVFKRRHYIFGGWAKHGTYPVRMLRMWRTGKGRCEERNMDEHMVLSEGRTIEFNGDFVDHNLNDLEWWKAKHRGYAKREAADALAFYRGEVHFKRSKELYYRQPPYLRVLIYFCIRYFLKGGFLDGRAGWMWNFWQGLWYRWLVDKAIAQERGKLCRTR